MCTLYPCRSPFQLMLRTLIRSGNNDFYSKLRPAAASSCNAGALFQSILKITLLREMPVITRADGLLLRAHSFHQLGLL